MYTNNFNSDHQYRTQQDLLPSTPGSTPVMIHPVPVLHNSPMQQLSSPPLHHRHSADGPSLSRSANARHPELPDLYPPATTGHTAPQWNQPPANYYAPPPPHWAAPIPVRPQFPYAAHLTGPSALPSAHSRSAPERFEGHYHQVEEFLEEVDALYQAHRVFDPQDQVQAFLRYCSLSVKEFVRTNRHYKTPNWILLKRDLITYYDAELCRNPYRPADLEEFIRESVHKDITNLHQWRKYYVNYNRIAGHLLDKNYITDRDRHGCFWKGVPLALKQVLEARLLALHPRYDNSHPWEMDDVCHVAESHFNQAKFEDTLMPFYDERSKRSVRISRSWHDSSDEDSDSSNESDSEHEKRSIRQSRKKKQHRRHKDTLATRDHEVSQKTQPSYIKTPPPSPSSPKRTPDTGQEVEELIHELSRMDITDPTYAGKYYRAARLDTLAVKFLPEPINRQRTTMPPMRYNAPMQSQVPAPAFYAPPAMSAPPSAPVPAPMPRPTYKNPNEIPLGGIPGQRPYDNRCFGCNDATHQIGSCPAIRNFMQQGIINRDPTTRRFSFWNGEAIWKRRGETLVDVVQRYLATTGYPTANVTPAQTNIFRIISPPIQEDYWDANYVEMPEEEEEVILYDYDSEDSNEGSHWQSYIAQETSSQQLFQLTSATQVATVTDSEVTDEDELEESFPAAYPATRQPERDKIMTRARQTAAQGPLTRTPQAKKDPPAASMPASSRSKQRPPARPIPEAPAQRSHVNLPKDPTPIDARQPRNVPLASDVEMLLPTQADKPHNETQQGFDGIERTRFPRQSELSAQIDPRAIANKLLDQPVQLPIREVLGASREVAQAFGETMRIRALRPPKEITANAVQPVPRVALPKPPATTVSTQHIRQAKKYPLQMPVYPGPARSHEVIVPAELSTERQALLYLPVTFSVKGRAHHMEAIIDTGSEINIMHQDTANHLGIAYHLHKSFMGNASGTNSTLTGRAYNVSFQLGGGVDSQATFLIGEDVAFSILLGQPWIVNNRVSIDQRLEGTFLMFKNDNYDAYAEMAVKTHPRAAKVGYMTLSVTRPDSPMDWTPTPILSQVNIPSTSTVSSNLFSPVAEQYGFVSFGPTQSSLQLSLPQPVEGQNPSVLSQVRACRPEIYPQPMDVDFPPPVPGSQLSNPPSRSLAPRNASIPTNADIAKGVQIQRSRLSGTTGSNLAQSSVPPGPIWQNVPMPRRNGGNPSRFEQTSPPAHGLMADWPTALPPDRTRNGTTAIDPVPNQAQNRRAEGETPFFSLPIAQNPRNVGQLGLQREHLGNHHSALNNLLQPLPNFQALRQLARQQLTSEAAIPAAETGTPEEVVRERHRQQGHTIHRLNGMREPSTPLSPPPPYIGRVEIPWSSNPVSPVSQLCTSKSHSDMASSHTHTPHHSTKEFEQPRMNIPGTRPVETLHSASISLNTTLGFVLPPVNEPEDPTRAFARVIMPVTTLVVAKGNEIHSAEGQMYGCFHFKSSDSRMQPICDMCHTVIPTCDSSSHHHHQTAADPTPSLFTSTVAQNVAGHAHAVHGEAETRSERGSGEIGSVEDVTPPPVSFLSHSSTHQRALGFPGPRLDGSTRSVFDYETVRKNTERAHYVLNSTGYPDFEPAPSDSTILRNSDLQPIGNDLPCLEYDERRSGNTKFEQIEPGIPWGDDGILIRPSNRAFPRSESAVSCADSHCKCRKLFFEMREPYSTPPAWSTCSYTTQDLEWDSCAGSACSDEGDYPEDVEMTPPLEEFEPGEIPEDPKRGLLGMWRRFTARFKKAQPKRVDSTPGRKSVSGYYAHTTTADSRPRTPKNSHDHAPMLPRPRSAPTPSSSALWDRRSPDEITGNPVFAPHQFSVAHLASRFSDDDADDDMESTTSSEDSAFLYAQHTRRSSTTVPHPLAVFRGQPLDWDQHTALTVNHRSDFSREEQSFLNELQADCAPWVHSDRYAVTIPSKLLRGAHLEFTNHGRDIQLRLPKLDDVFTRAYTSWNERYESTDINSSTDNEDAHVDESSDDGHLEMATLQLRSPPPLPDLHSDPIRAYSITATPQPIHADAFGTPQLSRNLWRPRTEAPEEPFVWRTSHAEGPSTRDGNKHAWEHFRWGTTQMADGNTETWTVGACHMSAGPSNTASFTPTASLASELSADMETEGEEAQPATHHSPHGTSAVFKSRNTVPSPPRPSRTRTLQTLLDALAQLDAQVGNLERLAIDCRTSISFRSRDRAWCRMVTDEDLNRIRYWEENTDLTRFELDRRLCRLNQNQANPWVQHGTHAKHFRQSVNNILKACEEYLTSQGHPNGIRDAYPLEEGLLCPHSHLLLKHEARYFTAIIKYFRSRQLHHYTATFRRVLRAKVSEPHCLSDLISVVLIKSIPPYYHLDPVNTSDDHLYQD